MLGSREQFWITCDHEGCYASSDEGVGETAESEVRAERDALELGFVYIDGKWFCEAHNPNREDEA